MRDHHKLKVYRGAEELVVAVYRATAQMPFEERFGLRAQMRAAAISVASNIAEGSSRTTDRDFARFIEIALGSARELACQIALADRLGLSRTGPSEASGLCEETTRMLVGLLHKLKQPPNAPALSSKL